MSERKKGELEAITILGNIGIEVDTTYYDDNSHKSMPDIRCKDGRYIEVTHTPHNHAITTTVSKFDRLQPGEDWSEYTKRHLDVEKECRYALDRVHNSDYEKDDKWRLTPAGQAQFKKDAKLLKEHMGYDITEMDFNKRNSEFKCDHPTIHFSTDNILIKISEDKGRKYPDGDVDLFIFATDEEFRLMKDLIPQRNWNGTARVFLNGLLKSPFHVIYVCAWCFEEQKYNTKNPELVVFTKSGNTLKWEWHNLPDTSE